MSNAPSLIFSYLLYKPVQEGKARWCNWENKPIEIVGPGPSPWSVASTEVLSFVVDGVNAWEFLIPF